MNSYEIDISKLDRGEMIAALYNNTRGVISGRQEPLMTKEEAQVEIDAILEGE